MVFWFPDIEAIVHSAVFQAAWWALGALLVALKLLEWRRGRR